MRSAYEASGAERNALLLYRVQSYGSKMFSRSLFPLRPKQQTRGSEAEEAGGDQSKKSHFPFISFLCVLLILTHCLLILPTQPCRIGGTGTHTPRSIASLSLCFIFFFCFFSLTRCTIKALVQSIRPDWPCLSACWPFVLICPSNPHAGPSFIPLMSIYVCHEKSHEKRTVVWDCGALTLFVAVRSIDCDLYGPLGVCMGTGVEESYVYSFWWEYWVNMTVRQFEHLFNWFWMSSRIKPTRVWLSVQVKLSECTAVQGVFDQQFT